GSVSRPAGTPGYVIGNLRKNPTASTTFEVGTASGYTQIDLVFTGLSGVNSGRWLTATSTDGANPTLSTSGIDTAHSANRYWTLTRNSTGGAFSFTSVNITLTFLAGDVDGGANTANFIMKNLNGSTWTTPGSIGTRLSTSTQSTGITDTASSFGAFAVGEA